MPEPIDVRAEFDTFFKSAYPWLASQLRAITGDAEAAHRAVDEAFVRCWRSWASVRRTADPTGWVRWTALRVAASTRRELPFRRRAPEPSAVTADSEEAVVLDALHRLPASQRRAIVLHYMGEVTVAELARRSGSTPDAVEGLLDTGFDALVGLLTWPDAEEDDGSIDPRYDWTAEALGDTATRLAADVAVPSPAVVLQRAAVLRWARRAVPVAVSAACVSSVVVLAAQLNPGGGAAAPRTPYTYSVAGPEPYTATQPYGTDAVVGEPATAAPEVPLGTSIVSIARSTPLADFGISVPASSPTGNPPVAGAVGASGSSGSAGTAVAGGSGGSGGGAATPPAGGSGTVPPASGAPGTVPPATVPASTVPPTTTPPTTPPPTTAPTTTTTPPPTTPPPTTTTTTAPPTTTPPPRTTTTEPPTTTTAAPAVTTKATTTDPAPVEPTTTGAAATTTTTTKPVPTTAADPTTAAAAGS